MNYKRNPFQRNANSLNNALGGCDVERKTRAYQSFHYSSNIVQYDWNRKKSRRGAGAQQTP